MLFIPFYYLIKWSVKLSALLFIAGMYAVMACVFAGVQLGYKAFSKAPPRWTGFELLSFDRNVRSAYAAETKRLKAWNRLTPAEQEAAWKGRRA